jgi:dephospho-CoA kinase
MKVLGLLGGIGSGKSLVAQEFARLGAGQIDADRLGHEVLDEPETRAALQKYFGSEVFLEGGAVDRQALARKVFSQTNSQAAADLRYLEGVTHPRILAKMQVRLAQLQAEGAPAVVLDAPVMLEAGWDRVCDELLFVEVPQAVRLARVLAARGWTEADFAAREAAQDSLDEKRRRADVIFDNSRSLACTRTQVERYWRSLFD